LNNNILKLTAIATVALLASILVGQNQAAYAAWGNPPSFGGRPFIYHDGLTINGKTFDIGGYAQTIPTQNLSIGQSSQITLKIFDNSGPTTIKGAALFINIRGNNSTISRSDTWIQYDQRGVYVHDPHNFIGKVTGSFSITYPFKYMTFNITPKSKLNTSSMGILAWDERYSVSRTMVVDALSFS
jgi:hypothetical protein